MTVVEVDAEARRRSRQLLVLLRVGQEDAATLSGGRKDVSRIVAARAEEGGRGFGRFRGRIGVRFVVRREVGALRYITRGVLRRRRLTGKDGRGRLRSLARLFVCGAGVCV